MKIFGKEITLGKKKPSDASENAPQEVAMKNHFCWNCGKESRIPASMKPGQCPACESDPK